MKKIAVSLSCMLIAASAGVATAAMVPNAAGLTGSATGATMVVLAVELPSTAR